MASKSKTKIFSVSSLDKLIDDLEEAQDDYKGAEEQAAAASYLFTWFGFMGISGLICVPASLLTGALAGYYGTVEDTISDAINELEEYKDFLQNNSNYNRVKMKCTGKIKTVNSKKYWIPSSFKAVAIHSDSGWSTL